MVPSSPPLPLRQAEEVAQPLAHRRAGEGVEGALPGQLRALHQPQALEIVGRQLQPAAAGAAAVRRALRQLHVMGPRLPQIGPQHGLAVREAAAHPHLLQPLHLLQALHLALVQAHVGRHHHLAGLLPVLAGDRVHRRVHHHARPQLPHVQLDRVAGQGRQVEPVRLRQRGPHRGQVVADAPLEGADPRRRAGAFAQRLLHQRQAFGDEPQVRAGAVDERVHRRVQRLRVALVAEHVRQHLLQLPARPVLAAPAAERVRHVIEIEQLQRRRRTGPAAMERRLLQRQGRRLRREQHQRAPAPGQAQTRPQRQQLPRVAVLQPRLVAQLRQAQDEQPARRRSPRGRRLRHRAHDGVHRVEALRPVQPQGRPQARADLLQDVPQGRRGRGAGGAEGGQGPGRGHVPGRQVDHAPVAEGVDGPIRPLQAHRLAEEFVGVRREGGHQRHRRVRRFEQLAELLGARREERRHRLRQAVEEAARLRPRVAAELPLDDPLRALVVVVTELDLDAIAQTVGGHLHRAVEDQAELLAGLQVHRLGLRRPRPQLRGRAGAHRQQHPVRRARRVGGQRHAVAQHAPPLADAEVRGQAHLEVRLAAQPLLLLVEHVPPHPHQRHHRRRRPHLEEQLGVAARRQRPRQLVRQEQPLRRQRAGDALQHVREQAHAPLLQPQRDLVDAARQPRLARLAVELRQRQRQVEALVLVGLLVQEGPRLVAVAQPAPALLLRLAAAAVAADRLQRALREDRLQRRLQLREVGHLEELEHRLHRVRQVPGVRRLLPRQRRAGEARQLVRQLLVVDVVEAVLHREE